ncbi:CheY chemotaxis protein or a CheY-like REC (receiver) domain [Flavobacterium micromati]|uniref:CheY chemotaxis protein or a CheY-like REC (Receiver) domain n=1 Tax=Flavobacterium micromati TaxID=229205 RepID=A0A1M5PNI6_9FLAO|nr:response regulator [Flavobacterium micromati]MCL6462766.1 response regulator [Flavobacterium micromati]SHH03310.1 CheY chemotaxis protein or a CheY-like REC (receiver) domain [Flavobacterium micromati]
MLNQILCIDDDLITLMLCKKVISKTLFSKEIITMQNGEQAIAYFNQIKNNAANDQVLIQPQLIFLDLNMPVMGGWEFLDYFLEPEYFIFNTIKVVILSSTIDPKEFERSKKYPMVIDFLPKPISKAMLEHLQDKFDF